MPDLTWLGWIFVIASALSVIINIARGATDTWDETSPGVSLFAGIIGALWLVGFFTIGFTH